MQLVKMKTFKKTCDMHLTYKPPITLDLKLPRVAHACKNDTHPKVLKGRTAGA